MIKKLTFILLAASCMQSMYSQNTEKNEKFLENKTLFEELTNVKKKQDKFNLFLNMQGSFDANFRDGFEEGAFKMRQLRIEAKGNINNNINSMLDCPEHIQTSPIITLESFTFLPSEIVIL